MTLVEIGEADVPTCGSCESVLLYYVDTDDTVYWRCTSCNRVSYPGTRDLREMQETYERYKTR